MLEKIILSVSFVFFSFFVFAKDIDITKYGAVGDGSTLNTLFIQKAIDDCNGVHFKMSHV
jgi:hypothetical protein